jgi:hypothetical protein
MNGILLAGLSAVALASGAVADTHKPTVFDQARARQTFYPVGHSQGEGLKLAYYVLGGELSERNQLAIQSAVLVNVTHGQQEMQVVELQVIHCASGRLTPTFRMMFGADGSALSTSGPVSDEARETLLSPEAERQTVHILCSGEEPANAMFGKTITELR